MMPVAVLIYLIIFAILIVINSALWVIKHGKTWVLFYELLSGSYLIFAAVLYYTPALREGCGIWTAAAVPIVLILECVFSVCATGDQLLPDEVKASGAELDISRCISILFSAPAYIIAARLFIDSFL